MCARAFAGFQAAPCRSAAAGMDDINIVFPDQAAQPAYVEIHGGWLLAVDGQVDMRDTEAGQFRNAHPAVRDNDGLRFCLDQFSGDIDATLLCPAGTKAWNNLHDDRRFMHRGGGHETRQLLLFTKPFNTLRAMQTNPPAAGQALPPVKTLISPQGRQLAYHYEAGEGPLVVYLPGYASDMMATKAQFLAESCAKRGQAYLRFDYSGTGRSPGEFSEGTIGRWTEDALAVIDHVASGPVLLVGSSMGGWIGLHCAVKRRERIHAFIGIAAAPDFTAEIWGSLSPEEKDNLTRRGYHEKPTTLDPLRIYKGFVDDSWNNLILSSPLDLPIPMTLLQGKLDQEVPWPTAQKIKDTVSTGTVDILYVEDGDHRLARPQDLEILDFTVRRLSARLTR